MTTSDGSDQSRVPTSLYSYRSATSGSTFAARRAGSQQATSPVMTSSTGTHVSVQGSYADTPQSCVAITPPSNSLAISPSATPIPTNRTPIRITSPRTSQPFPPTPLRIPIPSLLPPPFYPTPP